MRISRREALRRGSVAGFAGAAGWYALACSSSTNNSNSGKAPAQASASTAAGAAGAAASAAAVGRTATAAAATRAGTPGPATPVSVVPGKPGGNLVLTGSDLQQLDFQTTISTPSNNASSLVFNRLMKYDPFSDENTYNIVPDVASSWEVTGESIIFHLRKDVTWQKLDPLNGRGLVANDVKYSLTRLGTNKPEYVEAYKLDPIASIDAPDDYTLVLHLKRPSAGLMSDLASGQGLGIIPHEIVEADGDLNKRWVGTGPFMLDKWQKGSFIRFVKNPNYWKPGLPYLDSIQWNFIADPSTNLANFLAGQLHFFVFNDPSILAQLQKSSGANIKTFPNLGGVHKIYNIGPNGVVPLKDLRVRQAIDMAIDRGKLLDLVLGGDGVWSGTPIPLQFGDWSFTDSQLKQMLAPNPTDAKKLMDATGLGRISVITEYSNIDTQSADELPLLKQMLAPIGIDLQLTVQERTIYLQSEVDHSFHFQASGVGSYADPDNYLFPFFGSTGTKNYGQVSDPELDKRIQDEQSQLDHAQRVAQIKAIQMDWRKYLYRTYTLNANDHVAWQKNIVGQFIPKGFDYQQLEAVSFA